VAQTLLRGLRLLETVDVFGPLSISALARHLGVDKATASRMVASCEPDGWLVRDGDGVRIGPRAALLGQGDRSVETVRLGESLVHAVSGVTGAHVQAVGLVGRHVVVLASAGPQGMLPSYGLSTTFPLWLSAAGKVVAAQLTPARLDDLLPDPFPSHAEALATVASPAVLEAFAESVGLTQLSPSAATEETTLAGDRAGLDRQLEGIRRDGMFLDLGELIAETACIAVPWSRTGLVGALTVVATRGFIADQHGVIERALRAAAVPGASRASIVAAAAAG
jgi:DNA-binding IclR family transcriptional regulator